MITFNLVTFIGNVGRNPETHQTQDGKEVTTFSLAVSQYAGKNEEGAATHEAMWLSVKCWGNLSQQVRQVITKGVLVVVSGRLAVRTYTDKQGDEQAVIEVIAQTVELLGGKKSGEGDTRQQAA